MLKLSDLAERPDFMLGSLSVSPARRLIVGHAGKANVEPVIMQVFLLLTDARGQVVTRTELFDQVWGGVIVGDDSLNRAVGKVRRILAQAAPGSFEIETIPRTGYRLLGDSIADGSAPPDGRSRKIPRRAAVLGALALVGAAAAGWWRSRDREQQQFEQHMSGGEAALDFNDIAGAVQHFRRAAAVRPEDPAAAALFAYSCALQATAGLPNDGSTVVREAEAATQKALRVNAGEPHVRLAQILLQRSTLDLAANEDGLRAILSDAPANTQAMRHLWDLLQSAGRSHDALAMVERALAVKPLAPANHFPRAQLLWILGREGEADRVINRAMEFWPDHPWIRFAQFIIFAFTGRERAALAMLDMQDAARPFFSPESRAVWRISLPALESPSPPNVAAARQANLQAAKSRPVLTRQAVMVLARLGEVDAAFEAANAQLLFRPAGAPSSSVPARQPSRSTAWIFAPWLFTPPVATMRADPRFKALCDGIGLSDYWTKRGIEPDYPIGNA